MDKKFWGIKMIFRDRFHAGEKLSEKLKEYSSPDTVIIAIPRGGIAVAYPVSINLGLKLTIAGVRKLPIPWNPEMGFGAIAEDGSVYINENVVRRHWIDPDEISSISERVLSEVKRRVGLYRKGMLPDFREKKVLVVDDGFATGYTAIATCQLVIRNGAKEVVLSAPCAPESTVDLLSDYADKIVVLIIERFTPFAVANYYRDFHDMSDGEVIEILESLENRDLIYRK